MATIDLNADLGENSQERVVSDDAALLRIVSSANVSCGFHAGTPEGIRSTLAAAVHEGVAIGAHPAYLDPENFGRVPVAIEPAPLQAHVEYQLGALIAMATAVNGRVSYVKPHGALYNAIAVDEHQAAAVVHAIRSIDPSLILLGLPNSVGLAVAEHAGLGTATEAFADRAYAPAGLLVPRSEPGAVLHDPAVIAERMVRLATEGVIAAIDGTEIAVHADSICVHGDSPNAVDTASATRDALLASGIALRPFAGGPG